MPNNRDYWKKRMEILEEARNAPIQVQIHRLEKQYKIAQNNIEQEIAIWYERFAENNQITISEAKKMLFADELKEFKWNVEEYIKYGKENALDQKWMKELENASARVHISRLEALNFQMQHQIEVLYGTHIEKIGDVLKDAYSNDYYHTAYEIQKGFNIGWDLHNINQDELNKLLSKPWTTDRQTFSDRIWTNKQKLIGNVRTQLTQSVITGKAPKELIKNISEQMKVDRYKAGRLVMTESAAFASAGQKDCFNTLGVEKFEIVATLDSHTSEICQNLDGHVFDMKDYEIGVTAPPFHVWCRTVTAPYFVDNYGVRAARNAEGKTYYVPSNMNYDEWKKSFVDGGSKDGLKKVDVVSVINNIMNSKQIQLFDDVHKNLIESDLKKVPSEQVQIIQNSITTLNLDLNGTGTCFYRPGTGYMELNMSKEPVENIRTFWHEYGHYIDDVKSNGLKLITDAYPGSNYTFDAFGVSSRAKFKHKYLSKGVTDLQNFLDQVIPSKYQVLGDDYGTIYLKETNKIVGSDWGEKSEDFMKLLDEIDNKLKKDLGYEDAEKFLKSLDYPTRPQYEDFFEWYRTPKRQTLKSKPKYKGAEDAWRNANKNFSDALNVWEKSHPTAYDEVSKIRAIYENRRERISAVTDLLDGLAHGEMGMNISWGGHSGSYFKQGDKSINEGFANWFQMMFQNDTEMLDYLEKYAPEAKSIFEDCFAELVKQTLGGD